MTRLTLDTIGLTGFAFDFESFQRPDPHPFVQALVRGLAHAQAKARELPHDDPAWIAAVRGMAVLELLAFTGEQRGDPTPPDRPPLKIVGPEPKTQDLIKAIESMREVEFGTGLPIRFGPIDHQGSNAVWLSTWNDKLEVVPVIPEPFEVEP